MARFNCSLYEINQARKMRSQSEGLLLPTKTKHICRKLNMDKVEDFRVHIQWSFTSTCGVWYSQHQI